MNNTFFVVLMGIIVLSANVQVVSAQEVKINDNLAIEADGTVRLDNDATVWNDLNVYPDAVSTRGGSPPDYVLFKDNGSGSTGVWLNMFDDIAEEEVFFTVQLPHAYKEGTNLQPHVHWTAPSGTPAGDDVVWGLEYSISNVGDTYGNTTIIYATDIIPAISTPASAGQHVINSFPEIDGSTITLSSIISCRLFRAAGHASDTFVGDVGLLSFDFHYEEDTQGSRLPFVK